MSRGTPPNVIRAGMTILGRERWNQRGGCSVQPGMDEIEREAIRAEGYDPDDPAVVWPKNGRPLTE